MAKKPTNKKEVRTSNIPPQKGKKKENDTKEKGVLTYRADMTVADIASEMGKTNSQVIMKLMQLGIMANQNQTVDRETIELVAMDFGFEVKDEVITDAARFDEMVFEDDEADLVSRPPVVTIMGHVDHGKTTLLDTIRNSRVAKGEAGGITQHIGAYQVNHEGFLITFIDTPGHAAFTQMRARGAQITDIVILVVAADDGVMPQTEEAIAHAKAAGCPIIVAVNKMDKPTANMDRVKQELANYDLLAEDWGGDTIFCPISALKGTGVDDLLGMVQLVAEMKDLKANPKRLAMGSVIEAQLDKGKGPVATLLVQNGTLKVGDCVVVGTTWGKIRTMEDDHHSRFTDAEPSLAVAVTGLNEVPMAGDKFMVFADERTARETAAIRQANAKALENTSKKAVTLEELFSEAEQDKEKILNLIIKGDVQGSVEALKASLEKIQMDDVKVNIIRATVGAITDTDVSLAEASHAIIIGFNVRPMAPVRQEAQTKGVEIRLYNIIYKVIEEIEAACKGLLDPEFEEVVTGQAEVRTVFKISKIGTIAGCYVTDGVIERNSLVRILRDGVVVFEGKMASLKRFKDDVKEVKYGFECGIGIENYNDIKEGDVIEASIMKEIPR
ncbi:translation initiation factor IF-2 [Anaeroplasma bactoclasticum]|uniref:Translation initiation factor IF-2 n=1 Tax=Anaeroplasma bactoclasticum TaxID=2088 RepID=A0A397RW89_9MOLU|nr:translation initiation factor IF-2 [Anaeroplasma bactoclasticum]RIA77998.1 translation initiation factor IF-2 [Anaeroplasma bactoclasticum]